MKRSTKFTLIISASIVLAITLVSAIFSLFAMVYKFDHTIQHFNGGPVHHITVMSLPFAAVIVGIVSAILIRKKVSFDKTPEMGAPTVFTSVFMGSLMVISAFVPFLFEGHPIGRMSVAACVFAAIAGIYFLVSQFVKNQWVSLLSFTPAIWAALKLLEEYFREGSPINAPIKTINITMFAFLLLFFAEEVRFTFDAQLPPSYYFCLFSAAAFTGSATLPKLSIIILNSVKKAVDFIASATGNKTFLELASSFSDNTIAAFDFNIIDWCLGFAIFLYIITRFIDSLPALGKYVERKKKKKS